MIAPDANELFNQAIALVISHIESDRRSASRRIEPLLAEIARRLFAGDFNVAALERCCGLDSELRRQFRADTGRSPQAYLIERRMQAACWLLAETDLRVLQIARFLGHHRSRNFSQAFRKWSGQRPGEYRTAHRPARQGERGGDVTALGFWWRAVAGALAPAEARRLIDRLATLTGQEPGATTPPSAAAPVFRILFRGGESEEEQARLVWSLLEPRSAEEQRELLRTRVSFGSPFFFHWLGEKSLVEGRRDRRHGVELAELALIALEGSAAHLAAQLPDLRALAWARLANARRLALDFPGAEQAIARAEGAWQVGKNPAAEAEAVFFKATLRLFQRRFSEANDLLHRAVALCRACSDHQLLIKALIQRAKLADFFEHHAAAIVDLREARQLLGTHPNLYLEFCVAANLATSYAWAGEHVKVLESLPTARTLGQKFCGPLFEYQLDWLEGIARAALNDEETAERLFQKAREGMIGIQETDHAAVISLELATLHFKQGRVAEAVSLATEALPIFQFFDIRPEIHAVLGLLRHALEVRQVTLELFENVRESLRKLYQDPWLQSIDNNEKRELGKKPSSLEH